MPEMPMMPRVPDEENERNLTLPELEAGIKRLSDELDDLYRQRAATIPKREPKLSGEGLPNIEEAAELEPRPGHSSDAGGGMTGNTPLERQIEAVMNKRARYILRRDELLKGMGGSQNDPKKG